MLSIIDKITKGNSQKSVHIARTLCLSALWNISELDPSHELPKQILFTGGI